MGLRAFRRAGLGIVLAAGLTAACGSPAGSKTSGQLVPQMQAAANAATSVHVAGSVLHGSQMTTIDVSINGDSAAGYLGAYGTRFYVWSKGGTSFVKLNAAFLNAERAPASLCATVCGKYVELPDASAIEVTALLSMQQLVREVFDTSNMSAFAASGCIFSPAALGGQAVLECRQGSDQLDVAARGQPHLVYWSGPRGQHLAFSDWNAVVLPPPPPASQVVSYSSLG